MPLEVEANFSSGLLEVNGELISNISTSIMDVKGVSSANISGSTKVEVFEGQDVMLTFVIEAYPPIRSQSWTLPAHISNYNNMVYQESYTANRYRLAS